MKSFRKSFTLLFLVFFSIPFVSCKHADIDKSKTQWVTLSISSLTCAETLSNNSFETWANGTCTSVGMKYLGQSRCKDDEVEVLCGDL